MALKKINFLGNKIHIKHDLILRLITGKSVVHYGCVDDDLSLIEAKLVKGYYLHKVVSQASSRCVGIDINQELIDVLAEKHDIRNVVYGDVERPDSFQLDLGTLKDYQVLLIPDLIEHLNNVGQMLEGIVTHFSPSVKILIMTPNPCGYLNFLATLLRRELYTDHHTCLFTTECMKVILRRHGIKIVRIYPVFVPKERNGLLVFLDKVLGRIFTLISPGFADLYMYECSIETK